MANDLEYKRKRLRLLELKEKEAMASGSDQFDVAAGSQSVRGMAPSRESPVGLGTAFEAASELAPWNTTRKYTTELGGEKAAVLGNELGWPKTGAAIGMGIQMIPDILASTQPPQSGAFRGTAEDFGRRALGYNKGLIKRAGGVPAANKVAGQMLDEGVISAFASPQTMLERAKDVSQTSGRRIGETLSSINQPATTTQAIKGNIASQMLPQRQGGQYDKVRRTVGEIADTVSAHGPARGKGFAMEGPVSLESAQELKQTLKGPAQFGKMSDGERAELYRKAYGIVRESIDTGLENLVQQGLVPAEKAAQFMKDKVSYGASQQAIDVLKDKLAGEASNNIVSLRGTIAGGMAGMATGDIGQTLGALGGWEILRRQGHATAASGLNYLSKQRGTNTLRHSLITQFVDTMYGKGDQ